MSLKDRILRYIQLHNDRNVTTREIETRALEAGFTGRNAIRRTNELEIEGRYKGLMADTVRGGRYERTKKLYCL